MLLAQILVLLAYHKLLQHTHFKLHLTVMYKQSQ